MGIVKNSCHVDISQALKIEGWMAESELLWLAQRAAEHRIIVEIGSYLGRSTKAMLDNTEGVVYALDDWKGPRDVYIEKEARVGLFEKFMANINAPGIKGTLIAMCEDHESAYKALAQLHPDMVFIDGSHEYMDVKRDIAVWESRIASGGILCGHDIYEKDVYNAVSEVLGDVEIADNTSIWYRGY